MFSHILKKNMRKTGSVNNYMTPYIDKIISLFKEIEENMSIDCFEEIVRLEYPKGSFLHQEGSVPRYIWFLEDGLARSFMNKDGVDITHHFFCSGEFIFFYEESTLLTSTFQNIQLLQDSVVYAIRWVFIEGLKKEFPLLNQIEVIILSSYIGWLEKKMCMCKHASAKERYQYLMHMQPYLLEMVPHHYIASYLDITRETLSRIRTEYKEGNVT